MLSAILRHVLWCEQKKESDCLQHCKFFITKHVLFVIRRSKIVFLAEIAVNREKSHH